eukprot:CAMPEP_0119264060 /NCGR_PEP_ID=MMETSP1329-20130426/3265_1 /TAXON_ID=114041 /ORGANISM="Genus nov. species nov., Strain RCC1024" /LENGTH=48 /DNA_ID= /DNA_START= /DNA_END= /DNA_ORIENTATION=
MAIATLAGLSVAGGRKADGPAAVVEPYGPTPRELELAAEKEARARRGV